MIDLRGAVLLLLLAVFLVLVVYGAVSLWSDLENLWSGKKNEH